MRKSFVGTRIQTVGDLPGGALSTVVLIPAKTFFFTKVFIMENVFKDSVIINVWPATLFQD